MEKWKIVEDFPNYSVSNEGKVKNNNTGSVLKEQDLRGYKYVRLYIPNSKGKFKKYQIHRLVANTFIPNPNNYPQVNHKDENKSNNTVWVNEDGSIDQEKSNLEWCTAKYNNTYGSKIERTVLNNINHPQKSKQVNQYTLNGELIATFPSVIEIHRKLGYSFGAIADCCRGTRNNNYKGYMWKYKKVDEN